MNKNKFKIEYNIWVCGLVALVFISAILNGILLFTSRECKIKYVTDQNIVFFGDSITEGYNIGEFFPDTFVINSGVGGNKTDQLLDRIEKDVYNYNPSKVFILIGINDLSADVPKNEILNNIQKIINGIKINRKYSKIYIESIYPINRDVFNETKFKFNDKVTNDTIKEINTEIKQKCKENKVTYLNVYDSLTDKDGNLKATYTKEGLHLTDLGYFKVTKVLERYVEE
jgi:lysophospholipase L1-like esterase